jgi:autophagy-related protein 16
VQSNLGKLADLEGQVARSAETLSELVQVTAEKDGIIELLKGERDGNSTRAIAAEAKAEDMRRERDDITARYLEIKRKEADALNELTLEAQAAAKKQKEKALADAVAQSATLFPVDLPSGSGGGAQWSRVPDALGKTLVVHEASINGVMFSPDGGRFFTCSDDKTARVFDAQATRCVMTIRSSTQGVINAVPSATGDTLLLSSNDKSALLYNLATDKVKHTLTGHTEKILACAFNYDMKTAFTGSHDRTLKQWDADRGYNLRTVICISGVYDMGILSDGVTVISGHHDGKLRRWDSRAKEVAEVR